MASGSQTLPVIALVVLSAALSHAQPAALVRNGPMEGPGQDHSDGKGQLVTPEGWTPVNVDTNRGDRLAVEPSDRPGGKQCLRIKTFGSDAGVYQSLAPLEKGKTYLVSAWVKRLSGTLAVEAYPYAWGPAVMRRLDGHSAGWTRLTVGLTPLDGGAHLYLVAAPEADFLIEDVQVAPATVQVSVPEPLSYDFREAWRYRTTLTRAAPGPTEVSVRAVAEGPADTELGPPQRAELPAAGGTGVELRLPLRAEGSFAVEVTDAQTGEPLGGSPLLQLLGDPWDVRYPHKNSLYATLGYRWPLEVRVRTATRQTVQRLRAAVALTDAAGKTVRTASGSISGDAVVVPVDGRGLSPGEYRLRLTVRETGGRVAHQDERTLHVLPPGPHEVVCSPEGRTLVDGKPFFPIGLYWVLADPAGWKPGPARKTAELRELQEAGFNTLHTYAFEHNDANDTDDNAQAYLDMAQEFGFRVMLGLRRDWCQGEELNVAAVEQRVRRLRDHPALLCWTLWDEPNFDLATVPRVQALYDLVDRLDPYHPAMPVFGGPDGRPFGRAADANLFDCYPGAGGAGVLKGVLTTARTGLPDKPIWFVAQAFRSGDRLPSEEDMRLFWQHALEGGARAIFWYSYGGDGKEWDSIRTDPAHFESVTRVVGELARRVAQE